jgi:hypothetical protein
MKPTSHGAGAGSFACSAGWQNIRPATYIATFWRSNSVHDDDFAVDPYGIINPRDETQQADTRVIVDVAAYGTARGASSHMAWGTE